MKKIIIISSAIFVAIITSIVGLANSEQEILAKIESFKIFVNGSEKVFQKPIVTINDNTYIPLREAAESLGMEVNWNDKSQTITINKINDEEEISLKPFELNGFWGYMDTNGKVVVEPKYIEADEFKEGLALVRKSAGQNGQYGFIDENGNEVITCNYYMAYPFNDSVALVSLATKTDEDRWTYIDKQGNRLFDKEFSSAHNFSEGYAGVLKEGNVYPAPSSITVSQKWSYIDKNGDFVTELDFEEVGDFKNGYAIVKNDNKWGVIDKNFELVIPYQYDEIKEFGNRVFAVRIEEVWKYVDTTGNEIYLK